MFLNLGYEFISLNSSSGSYLAGGDYLQGCKAGAGGGADWFGVAIGFGRMAGSGVCKRAQRGSNRAISF